jgi:hypothetical protein
LSPTDLILGAVALAAMFSLLVFVRSRARRAIHSADPKELQSFLAICVTDLRSLLDRKDLDLASLNREAEIVFARMQSRNSDGNLDAFIQDNRMAFKQACARRNAA